MMAATGTRRAKFSRPSHRLGQAATRQAQSHARQQAPRPDRPRCRLGQALGRHINHWGQGHGRAALSCKIRIPRHHHQHAHRRPRRPTVIIRNKQRKSSRWRTCRLHGDEFDRRFLQHVLPKGFHKVRYFGLAPFQPPTRSSFFPCSVNLQPTFIAERGAD